MHAETSPAIPFHSTQSDQFRLSYSDPGDFGHLCKFFVGIAPRESPLISTIHLAQPVEPRVRALSWMPEPLAVALRGCLCPSFLCFKTRGCRVHMRIAEEACHIGWLRTLTWEISQLSWAYTRATDHLPSICLFSLRRRRSSLTCLDLLGEG